MTSNIVSTPEQITADTQWPAMLTFENKCTLSIIGLDTQALKDAGFSESIARRVAEQSFWEFLLLSLNEQHSDGASVTSVHADGMCVYGTGPTPVRVSMQMAFRSDVFTDDVVNFLWMYINVYRGSKQHKQHSEFLVWVEDTWFNLHPNSIHVQDTAEYPDYKIITMQGIGYKYGVFGLGAYSVSNQVVQQSSSTPPSVATTVAASQTSEYSEAISRFGIPTSFADVAENIQYYFPNGTVNLLASSASSSGIDAFIQASVGASSYSTVVTSIKNQCVSLFPFASITGIEVVSDLPLFPQNLSGAVARISGASGAPQYVYLSQEESVLGGVKVLGTLDTSAYRLGL